MARERNRLVFSMIFEHKSGRLWWLGGLGSGLLLWKVAGWSPPAAKLLLRSTERGTVLPVHLNSAPSPFTTVTGYTSNSLSSLSFCRQSCNVQCPRTHKLCVLCRYSEPRESSPFVIYCRFSWESVWLSARSFCCNVMFCPSALSQRSSVSC